ncbi:MAG TPA: tRNA (adenosine(37)-N6)-threonylcarbamoyltransferase complex dimerization subunit type 1 TsaB [Rhodocyclaceae bacterium]|nr:tRNA (adenosine(37)-N6)-threonylcarbamoyltransferase complex dimerization subunit type 1 TsaB [Rhodocyclaceae bacterium]
MPVMRILGLETSTDLGSCALWLDGELTERRCPAGRPHSETLLPLVRDLLAEAGVEFSHLDAVAFGAGPGAFTGLRVACGVAQGLAVAADIPVVPVGTLEALAADADGERVLALLDARMNEVYYAAFERNDDGLKLLGDVRVAPPAEVVLPEGDGWLACGNALAAYPVLAQRIAEAGMAAKPDIMPTAAAVVRLALPRLEKGEAVDPALAVPFYVRDKVAQTVAERLAGGGKA